MKPSYHLQLLALVVCAIMLPSCATNGNLSSINKSDRTLLVAPVKGQPDITPFSPPSGPATGFSNGPHPKSKFLAFIPLRRRRASSSCCW